MRARIVALLRQLGIAAVVVAVLVACNLRQAWARLVEWFERMPF